MLKAGKDGRNGVGRRGVSVSMNAERSRLRRVVEDLLKYPLSPLPLPQETRCPASSTTTKSESTKSVASPPRGPVPSFINHPQLI